MDDSDYLRGVDFDCRDTDTVVRGENGYFVTVRGIGGEIDVVQAEHFGLELSVQLEDDLFSLLYVGGDVSDAGSENELSVVGDVGDFDDCFVNITVETVSYFLRELGEVEVEVVAIVRVDAFAQIGCVLVGSALAESVSACEGTIGVIVS